MHMNFNSALYQQHHEYVCLSIPSTKLHITIMKLGRRPRVNRGTQTLPLYRIKFSSDLYFKSGLTTFVMATLYHFNIHSGPRYPTNMTHSEERWSQCRSPGDYVIRAAICNQDCTIASRISQRGCHFFRPFISSHRFHPTISYNSPPT